MDEKSVLYLQRKEKIFFPAIYKTKQVKTLKNSKMKTNQTARFAQDWQMPVVAGCPVANYIGRGDSWGVFALFEG
jgi:hypothetical protein